MKNVIISFAILAFVKLLSSCASDSVNDTDNAFDVYVTGSKNGHACYWKNNQYIALSDAGFSATAADTIIVENNNVYITGFGDNKNLYWENNILTNLTDTFSTPTDILTSICSMDVENNDIYFLGVTENLNTSQWDLAYWKNGVKNIISSFSTQYFYFHMGIKVVGNDIYINAPEEIAGVLTSGYYVNGVFFPQNNATLWGCDAVTSDVYVFGSGGGSYGYYKNITTNTETTFESISPIIQICFDNGSVYCSNNLSVFKNGNSYYTIPSNNSANLTYYRMNTFKIVNNSLYVITEEGHYQSSNSYDNIYKLLIDDVVSMQSAADERYSCLFVVQN